MRDQAFYFGCHKDTGHYLWVRGMEKIELRSNEALRPFLNLIDGGFIPHGSNQQGRAWLSHVGDWTFLAFADNSIDTRGQSHSTFVQSGRLTYAEMELQCRANFPEVWARFGFKVYPADAVPEVLAERPPMKKNVPGEHCPVCTEPEVAASGPRTVYACDSSDLDQRPGTFKSGIRCITPPKCPVCDDRGITNLRDLGHRTNAFCDGKPKGADMSSSVGEKAVEQIMKNFDFNKVHKVMKFLDWTWQGKHPSLEDVKKKAKSMLTEVASGRFVRSETCGFIAENTLGEDGNFLQLCFNIEKWNTDNSDFIITRNPVDRWKP